MTNTGNLGTIEATNPVLTVAPLKEDTEMLRATEKITALYCRLSVEDMKDDKNGGKGDVSNSIQNQKDILLRYAKEHRFPNPTFFVDDGYSGSNYDRPGFQQMLSEIEAGKVAVVLSKDLSRLGRNSSPSDLAQEFLLEPHENGSGIRGLFYGEEGFRHFFTVKPVSGMEDLAGMKIRVSNDPIMTGMVEALGANPTVVAMGELYSALQTGVVDAAEQPIANYQANAFPEVANNLILDGHTLGAIQVVITDEAWDKLTPEQQDVLTEAGEYASQYNRKISEETENKILDELKADGCNVVEVEDITPWQDACKDVIEEATKDNKELYQQILDMAN